MPADIVVRMPMFNNSSMEHTRGLAAQRPTSLPPYHTTTTTIWPGRHGPD